MFPPLSKVTTWKNMDVDAVLTAHQSKFKTTDVSKEVDLVFDLGHLMATDLNNIDTKSFKENKEQYLHDVMRDNTQLLINEIWKLPIETANNSITVQLPTPKAALPREKPIPKPNPPTKWEKFAKDKGLVNRKRSQMMFDEKSQEWKPRWGYKRVNDPKDDWMLEVPDNADPYEDLFEKKSEARKEKIAKNEYQRLRNIARADKRVPLPPSDAKKFTKHQYNQALAMSRKATASVGKFTPKLPSEPAVKSSGKKNKFLPVVGNMGEEKGRHLELLKKLSKKSEALDTTKATNKFIAAEQESIHRQKQSEGGKRKKQKKGVSHKAHPKPAKQMKQRAKRKKK